MKRLTYQKEVEIEDDLFFFDFRITILEDRSYGADADGRRGEYRAWIQDYSFDVEVLIDNKLVPLLPSDYCNYTFDINRYAKKIIDELNVSEVL